MLVLLLKVNFWILDFVNFRLQRRNVKSNWNWSLIVKLCIRLKFGRISWSYMYSSAVSENRLCGYKVLTIFTRSEADKRRKNTFIFLVIHLFEEEGMIESALQFWGTI